MMIRYLTLVFAFLSMSCVAELKSPISIINLISSPEKFDGKTVRVIGYGVFDEYSTIVCLNEDDIEFGISKNCVWVGLIPPATFKAKELSNSYVDLEGVFNQNKPNHTYTASGMIKNVEIIFSSIPEKK